MNPANTQQQLELLIRQAQQVQAANRESLLRREADNRTLRRANSQ